jgi:hypothetical protein
MPVSVERIHASSREFTICAIRLPFTASLQGADVQRLLHHLSVYLGHVHLRHTQVYLSMTPELLHEANNRFDRYASKEQHHA